MMAWGSKAPTGRSWRRSRAVLDAHDQHDQAAHQEDDGHDGDQLLGDGGQALDAAQEDEAADDHQGQTPTIQLGTPKAVSKVEPMELDWTMQPMKPRARMMATAKKPARNLPKPPWKAVRM